MVGEQHITMVSIVSENRRLLVLICIVGLLLHTTSSTPNTQSKRESSLHSNRRLVEKSLDANYKQGASVFNVDMYGASGNGSSDDSQVKY